MKSVSKRLLCFFLAMIMLPMCLLETALPAQAAYENTYVNTGDQRADIIGVAKTQVGYRESGGRTKYGEWYGYPTIEWCAVFIGWCADQAGIPSSIIKRQGWANAAAFGLKSYPASVRMPQPGDIFFRGSAHTGLVYYVEGNYFYTLEGNTWGNGDSTPRVMIRQRELYNSTYTFASPAYEGESGTVEPDCDHNYVTGSESAHPHKEYKKCTKCGYSYYTGLTIARTDCQECIMANCSHSYGAWSKVDGSYHKATCSKCGKVNQQRHNWGSDEIIKEPTCKDEGKKKQTCNECSATREVTIPATNEHVYTDWLYINEDVHAQMCESCEVKTEKPHTTGDWQGDTQSHWKVCSECGGRVSIGEHKLTGDCGTTCEICGLQPNSSHIYYSMWNQDETKHWQQCLYCSVEHGEHEHEFSADCDDTCDVCGYVREAAHVYGKQWKSDATGHWLSCQICGKAKEVISHTPGDEATEQTAQHCTVCDYEITPVLLHSHSYTYTYGNDTHTGVCECGATAENDTHIWDIQTGKCRICQMEAPPKPSQVLFNLITLPNISENILMWFIIAVAIAAVIVSLILFILIWSIIRRIRLAAAARLERELEEEDELLEEEEFEEIPDLPPVIPPPVEMPESAQADEQIDTEDILRKVAQIEGLSYEESIAAAQGVSEAVPAEETGEQEAAEMIEETEEAEESEETEETVETEEVEEIDETEETVETEEIEEIDETEEIPAEPEPV